MSTVDALYLTLFKMQMFSECVDTQSQLTLSLTDRCSSTSASTVWHHLTLPRSVNRRHAPLVVHIYDPPVFICCTFHAPERVTVTGVSPSTVLLCGTVFLSICDHRTSSNRDWRRFSSVLSTDRAFAASANLRVINDFIIIIIIIIILCFIVLFQGRHLTRGCSLEDYDIRLGDAVCVPLPPPADNEVNCRPPTNKPNKNKNDTFCTSSSDVLSLKACNYRRFNRTSKFADTSGYYSLTDHNMLPIVRFEMFCIAPQIRSYTPTLRVL